MALVLLQARTLLAMKPESEHRCSSKPHLVKALRDGLGDLLRLMD